jgi:hypothetical protein
MNLPRSCSHNGPTNPGNKSLPNSKRKHNSRGKERNQSTEPLVDSPPGKGARSAGGWWTVRGVGADDPYYGTEPPVALGKYGWSEPGLHTVRAGRTVRGLLGGGPQTARNKTLEPPRIKTPHAHELKNTRQTQELVDSPWPLGGSLQASNRIARAQNREVNSTYPSMDLPNG